MPQDICSLRLVAADLNGRMRGKRLPASFLKKVQSGTTRMPISALNLDIWGADIENSPLVFESGDADGFLIPTERGPLPMPWLDKGAALVPATMLKEDGSPYEGDPRRALARVLERYAARGWTVRAATEMEFYLLDDSGETPQPVKKPSSGRPVQSVEILSLDELDAFDSFFSALYEAADDMDIPAQSALSEGGHGQFEIDLDHRPALEAADNAWLFKSLTKGLARQHGMCASFMAKPFANDAGTGLHVHFSVTDAEGRNIFDDGSAQGNATLRHAVAGCLSAMRASTLVFAPHGPSYDRLVPGQHAPTAVCWGYENRTAAIRIPGGPPKARRIEHRVACGDTNPYLLLTAILGAALDGIERAEEPPVPITGNAYTQALPQLAESWDEAITLFSTDETIKRIFAPCVIENLTMTKRQEQRLLAAIAPENRWKTYIEAV